MKGRTDLRRQIVVTLSVPGQIEELGTERRSNCVNTGIQKDIGLADNVLCVGMSSCLRVDDLEEMGQNVLVALAGFQILNASQGCLSPNCKEFLNQSRLLGRTHVPKSSHLPIPGRKRVRHRTHILNRRHGF